nr:immunoglobulin heavy chain junction region [Macaca mulatta]MOW79025.1 immunoglobulin heavy chain junction region [Macaca mulatta]
CARGEEVWGWNSLDVW